MTKLTTRKTVSPKHNEPKAPLIKLTETQLIVLSQAAQRQDRAATLPDGIKDKVARKLAATLAEKSLVREVRAKSGMPVRRTSEEEGSRSMIITKLGRATNGAEGLGSGLHEARWGVARWIRGRAVRNHSACVVALDANPKVQIRE